MGKNCIEFSVLMSIYKNDVYEDVVDAVKSILCQGMKPTQVVVMLDGPVNDAIISLLKASKDDGVEFHALEKNVGLAKALNIGLTYCHHDIVARMDADDVSLPDRFESMIPLFSDNLALMGGIYDIYDENLRKKIGRRAVPEEHKKIVRFAKTRTPFNHPTSIIRKSAVLAVGGYPEEIGRFEDWGLSLRLINAGYVLKNIPKTVLNFRGGEEMMNRRSGWKYAIEELKALFKMYRTGLFSLPIFIYNAFLRFPLRLVPRGFLKKVYSSIQPVEGK